MTDEIRSMTEVERKYDVEESTALPRLDDFDTATAAAPHTLRAVYFDTADEALAAASTVLRRRTGGPDEGWHIKMASEDGRTEHHAELAEVPPAALLELVDNILRDRPLIEIAWVDTQRLTTMVFGRDDSPIAEIADDLVTAKDARTGVVRVWREWEIELIDGVTPGRDNQAALLDKLERPLITAGAAPSRYSSKLARALGRTAL